MLAALATLAFLATLWIVALAAVRTLDENGFKIAAALAGRSPLACPPSAPTLALRLSPRARSWQRPLRARPSLRAAA